ncbi:MAG TPA: TonB-dependent receptor [Gemmatimonadaceae bacterium]
MTNSSLIRALAFTAMVLGSGAAGPLRAQGLTTAAVSGTVTDSASGQGIESAQIQIVNRSTGVTTGGLTRAGGHFFIQGLAVGGPYSVTVRRIGYQPLTRDGVMLQLGENYRADFALTAQAAELAAVEVKATADQSALISPARKGIESFVSDTALRRMPTLSRNFTDFVRLTPQVSSSGPGNSAGGVNNRFNNIQIDGASENDLFGLGTTGQPGGQAFGKSISLEAVKEYQVVLSPYDVRQGNFAGALINAVTKSGTNELHGSAFYYFRNSDLAQNVKFIRTSDLSVKQYGFSLGGPIIKDKVHFFVAPEWQSRTQPAAGPYLGSTGDPLPVAEADVQRFMNDLKAYGIEPGSAGLVNNENPLSNIFARVDVALPSINSRLVARYNYGTADNDVFSRSDFTFGLSSNSYTIKNTKNAPVVQLFTNFSNGSDNELILGYNRIRDRRNPAVFSPTVSVSVPGLTSGNVTLRAGAEQFSQGNQLDQDIFEITDNYTFPIGTSHRVTVGTHDEFFKFRNLFTESSYGVWTFRNLDSLEAGNPSSYRVSSDLGGGVVARFKGKQVGAYVEDNWTITPNFSLTYGLRFDVPMLDTKPAYTASVDTIYGRRTDEVASGNLQWSPRIGFNWDVTGDQVNQIRGGVGTFVGRPAYVWLGNSYQNSGSGLGILNCSGSRSAPGPAPAFDPDATNPPTVCANGQGLGTGVVGPVDLMSKNLKYPQVLRASLAYDRQLPGGAVASLEAMYTKGLDNFFYINRNLVGPQGVDSHGRVMYGTLNLATGQSNPEVVSSRFSEVIDIANQSKDYSYNLTAELQKRFSESFEGRVAYTYSHSYDVQSLTSSRAISNWMFGRELSGNHLDQNTSVSLFDQPNKIVASGTYTFPWKTWATNVSLIYTGQSGAPYDYVYGGSSGRGDLNADGITGNDLVYVPTSAMDTTQIRFATIAPTATSAAILPETQAVAFDKFIDSQPCLRDHRGEIIERNTCRNPWQNFLDMTVEQSLPSWQGRTMSLRLDVFNVANLLNRSWGRVRSAGTFNNVSLLTMTGVANNDPNQPLFQFNPNYKAFTIQNDATGYYQIQLSARVGF